MYNLQHLLNIEILKLLLIIFYAYIWFESHTL